MFRSAFQLESALLRCVAAGYGSWFLCGVWRLALVHGFCVVCGGWLAVVRGVCEVCGGWLWFVVSVRCVAAGWLWFVVSMRCVAAGCGSWCL